RRRWPPCRARKSQAIAEPPSHGGAARTNSSISSRSCDAFAEARIASGIVRRFSSVRQPAWSWPLRWERPAHPSGYPSYAATTASAPAKRPRRAGIGPIGWPGIAVIIGPVVVAGVQVARMPIMVPVMRAMPPEAVPPAARFGRLRPEQAGEHDDGERHKHLLQGILRGITPASKRRVWAGCSRRA